MALSTYIQHSIFFCVSMNNVMDSFTFAQDPLPGISSHSSTKAGLLVAKKINDLDAGMVQNTSELDNKIKGVSTNVALLKEGVADGFTSVARNSTTNNRAIQELAGNWNAFSAAIYSVPLDKGFVDIDGVLQPFALNDKGFAELSPGTYKLCDGDTDFVYGTTEGGESIISCTHIPKADTSAMYETCVVQNLGSLKPFHFENTHGILCEPPDDPAAAVRVSTDDPAAAVRVSTADTDPFL